MKKWLAILLSVGVLAALGWQVYVRYVSTSQPAKRRVPPAAAVEAAPVIKADIRNLQTFTGTLLARSQFCIAPKVAGRLLRLTVDIGDLLSKGAVVAELDDDEYRQQHEQAKAELGMAKASVGEYENAQDVAARELERARQLHEKKVLSEADLDTAAAQHKVCQAKLGVALAQVQQKEAALKAAAVRLDYTKIKADWGDEGGTRIVGERFVNNGAMLAANDRVLSVVDLDSLIAVVHVIEQDYPYVHPGQEAILLTDAFPGRPFMGKVARVAPLLKETSRQARVEIAVPNADHALKPGMFVRAELEFDRHVGAAVVPEKALVHRGGKTGVFLVEPGGKAVRFIEVATGIVSGERVEIVSPAMSGWVVTLGQHLLQNGSAVAISPAGGSLSTSAPDAAISAPATQTATRSGGGR